VYRDEKSEELAQEDDDSENKFNELVEEDDHFDIHSKDLGH
jgi:hypothetical protein